jgi:purine-binding chemotaxis protein CheW
MNPSNESSFDFEKSDDHKYILFYLGNEIYATPLTYTREVVEVLPTKTIPNTVSSFLGVCNLRGQIVGVVDLKKRFSIESSTSRVGVYFVFDVAQGVMAAKVDDILCVDVIEPESIENEPNLVSSVPQKYIVGIAKYKNSLVTLVDFRKVLSQEEVLDLASIQTGMAA